MTGLTFNKFVHANGFIDERYNQNMHACQKKVKENSEGCQTTPKGVKVIL